MEQMKILGRFCLADHEALSEPFSQGEYSYASDGKIALRVKRLEGIPERKTAPDMNRLKWDHDSLGNWQDLPAYDLSKIKNCDVCRGSGIQKTCPECDGDGEVQLDTGLHQYEWECLTCDGAGHLPGDSVHHDRCHLCDGTGKDTTDPIEWGAGHIQMRLLEKIKSLPDVKLNAYGDGKEAFRFRFAYGEGVVMPTCGPNWGKL